MAEIYLMEASQVSWIVPSKLNQSICYGSKTLHSIAIASGDIRRYKWLAGWLGQWLSVRILWTLTTCRGLALGAACLSGWPIWGVSIDVLRPRDQGPPGSA